MPTTNTLPAGGSHLIDRSAAIAMTTTFRANREAVLDSTRRGHDILPLSETFNRQDIDSLLAQPGCAGLRIYGGMDEDKRFHAILVAVNEENEDMLDTTSLIEGEDDVLIEVGQRCPPACPPPSVLNA